MDEEICGLIDALVELVLDDDPLKYLRETVPNGVQILLFDHIFLVEQQKILAYDWMFSAT